MVIISLHPAVRLLAWSALVLALQWLALVPLSLSAAATAGLALMLARARTLRLFHRSRWVFVALIAVFALGTPGVLVAPALGAAGPSYDGLWAAAEHALRLAAIVCLVAILLETTPPEALVAGLHGLMAPLRGLGMDTRPAVVRLMLVMEYADRAPAAGWRDWVLGEAPRRDAAERFTLPRQALGWPDVLVLSGLAALAVAWL